jgi:multidrug efflux pump subunit AcrA (membrane-fusion protein)
MSSHSTTSGLASRWFHLGLQRPIGAAMASTMQGSPIARRARRVRGRLERLKYVFAGLGMILIASMLAIPMPYRVACDCVLEPSVRRYIAAPYEGRLEGSLIRPGDIVTTGQRLALMDARELKWELSGLEADYRSEEKTRDAASARDEVAVAQQSTLEMQQLELKMSLIRHRLDHLEIKSPIDGVVLSGDLSRSEGAPMTVGQTLFEIAPLDQMVVEVAIPESEIRQVEVGMTVEFRLDSDAQFRRDGKIVRIHPRPEIRQNQSVFIAEVDVDNRDHSLRPGTKGIARIETQSHSIAWNWTHKAWDAVSMNWGL